MKLPNGDDFLVQPGPALSLYLEVLLRMTAAL